MLRGEAGKLTADSMIAAPGPDPSERPAYPGPAADPARS
jgi:hypothetical protein